MKLYYDNSEILKKSQFKGRKLKLQCINFCMTHIKRDINYFNVSKGMTISKATKNNTKN